MKYYAVTEDPNELYHYGRLGMKWGKHIFGDKPKSAGYHRAVKKLKAAAKSASNGVKKNATQAAYRIREKQQNRFEKSVAKAQARLDKSNIKFDNYQADAARKSVEKQINKAAKAVKKQENKVARKENFQNAVYSVKRTANQIAQTKRDMEQHRFNKAVEKAQKRNTLSDALRGLDREEKLYKQADRERKMDALREKQADIRADNDLKALSKAARVEKNMPMYYQQARTGTLAYGKLSDEQIGRLQNRLALEANTRRLGSTEAPSWREQKKMARRQGYLQGITKGISAGMEEVGRASVQYGIRNLANRKKMDAASELKAEREKNANRIKNKKTHSEMREDLKDKAYEAQIKEGVHAIQRGALSSREAAKQLRYAENKLQERQAKIDEARDERKFLMEEKHNAARDERQRQKRLTEHEQDVDSIGKSLVDNGYAIIPSYDKQGKKNGTKLLVRDSDDREAKAYIALYTSKYGIKDKEPKISEAEQNRHYLNTIASSMTPPKQPTKNELRIDAKKRSEEFFKNKDKNAPMVFYPSSEETTRTQQLLNEAEEHKRKPKRVEDAHKRTELYKKNKKNGKS